MKTTKSKPQTIQSIIGLIPIACLFILVTGCQKDELPNELKFAQDVNHLRQSPLNIPGHDYSFTSINIQHVSMNSFEPDYIVTVESNGNVTYEGRRNVYVAGKMKFKIPEEKIKYLNNLYLEFNSSITFNSKMSGGEDLPIGNYVVTTCKGVDKFSQSYIDFNNGIPVKLVSFRKKVEDVLNISGYINTFGPFPGSNTME